METITLDRTGLQPIRFQGRLLATASGQFVGTPPDKPNVDWFEVSIYRCDGERFIVAVTYRRQYKGVTDEERIAEQTDDPARWLADFAAEGEPLDMLIGERASPKAQRQLEEKLQRQFDRLISAVLKEFPEEVR